MSEKEKLPKFTKNYSKKGASHPAYVFIVKDNEAHYIGITHAEITKGIRNIPLHKNPNSNDVKPAYLRPKAQKAHKKSFSKKGYPDYAFDKNDKRKVKRIKKVKKYKKSR